MIAYLKGVVYLKAPNRLILDVNDVGYGLEISTQTYEELPEEGEEISLLVHHHITDNDQRLFGFLTENEKELFELLITVKGVGPKLGLTILSGMPAEEITGAIVQQDRSALSQITGIGKKTADRMILELKDKMSEMVDATYSASTSSVSGNLKEEAISALESLGFKKREAEKAVVAASKANNIGENVQDLVKKALTQLNR